MMMIERNQRLLSIFLRLQYFDSLYDSICISVVLATCLLPSYLLLSLSKPKREKAHSITLFPFGTQV